jgi:uncharacterized protein YdaU (DUF1376 family)
MNDCHWYPRDPQRYLTDTQWCDLATEVAHVRMIDTYYALERPIKDEPSRIQNIGKIKDSDYARVRGNLFELGWSIIDGFWHHKRIEETMVEMEQNRKSQIERTKAATEARMKQRNEERDVERNVVPTTTTTTTTTKETATTDKERSSALPIIADIFNTWNRETSLPKCLVVSDKRRRSLEIRVRDEFFATNWKEALLKIKTIPFCMGKNERGWKASFDWFIQPDTVVKIIEGKYVSAPKHKSIAQ